MKKKVLLSSIATIALCLCLIAGSTFALFTDSTNFNIAVTSGDVEIEAYASINALYSAKGADAADDEFLVDENGHTYTHEKQDTYFLNGGTATLNGANLEIVRLTPGDRVDVDINVTNKSDVAMVYRYKIEANDTNLATGMVVTLNVGEATEQSYESFASWTSEWYPVITAPDGTPNPVPVKTVSIELPVYAGNEYQSETGNPQSVEYTIIVEAVQGNAVTDDESEVLLYPDPASLGPDAPAVVYDNESGIFDSNSVPQNAYVLKDAKLVGDNVIELGKTYDTAVIENVTAEANGNVIMATAYNTIVIADSDFTLDAGEMLVDDNSGSQTQIILINVTVNGVKLNSSNYAQYIDNPLGTILLYVE